MCLNNFLSPRFRQSNSTHSTYCLDTSYTAAHSRFFCDKEATNLGRIVHMRSATQLHAHITKLHYPYHIAILLPKKRHSSFFFGSLYRHLFYFCHDPACNHFVDIVFYVRYLLSAQRLWMGKVETESLRLHKASLLGYMLAQNFAESRMQDMGSGVVLGDFSATFVYNRLHCLIYLYRLQGFDFAEVQVKKLLGIEHIGNFAALIAKKLSFIAYLPAAFSIKRGLF